MLLILFSTLSLSIVICDGDDGIDFNLFNQDDYKIKFERFDLESYNKSYLREVSIKTFKFNRTTTAVNITFTSKINLGEDLVSVVQAYKFMSNEYRYFPLRFAANTCKSINANVIGLGAFKNCGNFIGCPLRKEFHYRICNWYPDQSRFPPLIPEGQYRIDIQLLYFAQELCIMNLYGTVHRPIV